MRSFWLQRAAVGALMCVALLVAACGGNVTITETDSTSPSSSSGSSGTPVPTLPPPAPPTPLPVTATPIPPPPPPPTPTPLPAPAPYTHLVYNQQTLSGSDVGPVTVNCPAGEVALSGGWATSGFGNVYNSTRTSNGWQIYVNHSGNDLINAYVECLVNKSSAVVTQRLSQITVPAGATSQFSPVYCQPGETVVGGGFALSSTVYVVGMEATAANQGWSATFGNYGSAGALANVYAICLQGSYPTLGPDGPATTVASGSTGGSIASCPAGYDPTGGGYSISTVANIYNTSPTNNGWETYISVISLFPANTVTTHALCAKFT